MYLRRVTIRNVRCFRGEWSFDIGEPTSTQPSWTLILGDNGTGKTSLLRALAMGLCDETSASGLLRELRGDFIRGDEALAEITLELRQPGSQDTDLTIVTTITRTSDGTEEVKQATTPEKHPLRSRIFACGYGARRAVQGSEQYERYRLIDSLYTLFNYDSALLNPEVYLLRLQSSGVDLGRLFRQLETVLMLPSDSVRLDRSGFVIDGPWGSFRPIGSVGDGYASTLAWVCDLFGWWSLQATSPEGELEGIVLIDELEQHLHPAWQRELISSLARAFPRIQFLATTHSPLAVTGSASLTDDSCQILLLEQKGDEVIAQTGLRPPRNRRADQVLTSYLFGLASTTSDHVAGLVARYSQLSSRKNLTEDERSEQTRLSDLLKETFSSSENALQDYVRKAISRTLEDIAREGFGKATRESVDFEVRRQLIELFGQAEST